MKIKKIQDLPLKNKKVIVRVDYNVPLKNNRVQDKSRIIESLPTIKYLLQQNCSIILISHLGRPDGKIKKELSLKPIVKILKKQLKKNVYFANNCIGIEAEKITKKLKPGQITLLENLRFHQEEELNSASFSKKLASLGEFYINDAFGTAHRSHASTVGITKFLPSAAGFLLQKEISNLTPLLQKADHPFCLIIGGAKMDTKIDLIQSFCGKADFVILGGGIANTFLVSKNYQVAASLYEKEKVEIARKIQRLITAKRKNLILPSDFIIAKTLSTISLSKKSDKKIIPENYRILDIGPKSIKQMIEIISKSKTIIWNGPVGLFEIKKFSKGTKAIAKAIAKSTSKGAYSVLGGGDTLEALNKFGISQNKFTHVSTGGGAMLEFLEKGTLPGIESLTA